jgi:predicted RNA-binding Zn-ribbon protein involved in translation (DUF1610 family)
MPARAPLLTTYSHFIDWDALGRRTAKALCGTYVARVEHTNTPTCPRCQEALRYREALERRVGVRS